MNTKYRLNASSQHKQAAIQAKLAYIAQMQKSNEHEVACAKERAKPILQMISELRNRSRRERKTATAAKLAQEADHLEALLNRALSSPGRVQVQAGA